MSSKLSGEDQELFHSALKQMRPDLLRQDTSHKFLDLDELDELAKREHPEWSREGPPPGKMEEKQQDTEEEEEDIAVWEEVANAILWTIPFLFLFCGMDFAAHSQYGLDLLWPEERQRLLNFAPALFTLSFIKLRPTKRAILPENVVQTALLIMSVICGVRVFNITNNAGYLQTLKQAPAYGTIWVWSVVQMDLIPAMLSCAGVGGIVVWNGDLSVALGGS